MCNKLNNSKENKFKTGRVATNLPDELLGFRLGQNLYSYNRWHH